MLLVLHSKTLHVSHLVLGLEMLIVVLLVGLHRLKHKIDILLPSTLLTPLFPKQKSHLSRIFSQFCYFRQSTFQSHKQSLKTGGSTFSCLHLLHCLTSNSSSSVPAPFLVSLRSHSLLSHLISSSFRFHCLEGRSKTPVYLV